MPDLEEPATAHPHSERGGTSGAPGIFPAPGLGGSRFHHGFNVLAERRGGLPHQEPTPEMHIEMADETRLCTGTDTTDFFGGPSLRQHCSQLDDDGVGESCCLRRVLVQNWGGGGGELVTRLARVVLGNAHGHPWFAFIIGARPDFKWRRLHFVQTVPDTANVYLKE